MIRGAFIFATGLSFGVTAGVVIGILVVADNRNVTQTVQKLSESTKDRIGDAKEIVDAAKEDVKESLYSSSDGNLA
jgi:hypothetical protein